MSELSIKQVNIIIGDVERADITFRHLQDDLIDHICCDVEGEMGNGLPFEKAYEIVKEKIGIDGLQQIKEDALLLINQKYRIMKKTMKVFGVVTPILLAGGSLLKMFHWPGAGIILMLGFFLFNFVFLPSAVYVAYCELSNRTKVLTHLSGFIAVFLTSLGFLFKIQHWPGAGVLIFCGILIIAIVFIPSLFFYKLKEAKSNSQKLTYTIGFVGLLFYLGGFILKIFHWPGATVLLVGGIVLLALIVFPMYVISKYRSQESVNSSFIFISVAMVYFIVPTMLFRLSVDVDVCRGFKDFEKESVYHRKNLEVRNSKLYEKLSTFQLVNDSASKFIVVQVKNNTDEIINYIQSVKVKLIRTAEGQHSQNVVVNENIDVDQLTNLTSTDACETVLLNDGDSCEAKRMKDKIIAYRNFANGIVKTDTSMNRLFEMSFNVSDGWEEYSFRHVPVITALNRLTYYQENIRMSESILLIRLLNQMSANKIVAVK